MRNILVWGFLALVALALVAVNVHLVRRRKALEQQDRQDEEPETWIW